MAETTGITWTDHTFNPWWGCVKVSPACTHCYAERDAKRYGHDVWGPEAERRFFGPQHWAEPLKWNKKAKESGERRRVFCASMADVFERHAIEAIDQQLRAERRRLINTIVATPMLDWLLLTKRPENIPEMLTDDFGAIDNVWLGVTAENQEYANARIGLLLKLPARVRFVSYEPALGPVLFDNGDTSWLTCTAKNRQREGSDCCMTFLEHGDRHFHGIDWVIAGGESGAGFRTANLEWYRSPVRRSRA
jgi:protein gp37